MASYRLSLFNWNPFMGISVFFFFFLEILLGIMVGVVRVWDWRTNVVFIFIFKKSSFGLILCCLGLFVWFFEFFYSFKGHFGDQIFNFSCARFKFMYNTSAIFSCWAKGGHCPQWRPPGPNIAPSLHDEVMSILCY